MATACSYRLLTHHVDLDLPAEGSGPVRAFVANDAEQDVPCRHRIRYRVEGSAGRVTLREGADRFAVAASMDEAAVLLDARIRMRVSDYLARAGRLILDAGLTTIDGMRCLVLGGGDGARAVLLVRLLTAGAQVDGGDIVAVRGGTAIAFPVPLRLPPPAVVPELGTVADEAPTVGGFPVLAPSLFGAPWHVVPGPVDVVIVLDDAAPPEPVRVGLPALVGAVVAAQVAPFVQPRGAAVREAAALVGSARGLQVGSGADAGLVRAMLT